MNKVTEHLDVVAWHDKLFVGVLRTGGEGEGNSDVGSSDEKLGPIIGHERGISTSFVFGQDLMSALFLSRLT